MSAKSHPLGSGCRLRRHQGLIDTTRLLGRRDRSPRRTPARAGALAQVHGQVDAAEPPHRHQAVAPVGQPSTVGIGVLRHRWPLPRPGTATDKAERFSFATLCRYATFIVTELTVSTIRKRGRKSAGLIGFSGVFGCEAKHGRGFPRMTQAYGPRQIVAGLDFLVTVETDRSSAGHPRSERKPASGWELKGAPGRRGSTCGSNPTSFQIFQGNT